MHCNRRSNRAGNYAAHRQPGAVSEYGGLRRARARTAWRDHSLRVRQIPLESKARIAVVDTVSRRAQRALAADRFACLGATRFPTKLETHDGGPNGEEWSSVDDHSRPTGSPKCDGPPKCRRVDGSLSRI